MLKYILSKKTTVNWSDQAIIINHPGLKKSITSTNTQILPLFDLFSKHPLYIPEAIEKLKYHPSHKFPDINKNLQNEIQILINHKILIPCHLSHSEYFKILDRKRSDMDFLIYDDWDMTVSNCGKNDLSKGCRSCKEGRWVCIFPSYACNANCKFCPRLTEENINVPVMDFTRADLLLMKIESFSDQISGISISGGEIFFKNYEISKYIFTKLKKKYPHIYLWGYTNGILASEDKMRELKDVGLDELRFNLAATNFNQKIIDNIKKFAVNIFPWVSVEIPIYSDSFEQLIKKEKLKEITEIGVKQLNLAEMRIPFPNKDRTDRNISPVEKNFLEKEEVYEFEMMSTRILSLVNSRILTYDVFKYAHENNLDIKINDCSQEAKVVQMSRRLARGLSSVQNFAVSLLKM